MGGGKKPYISIAATTAATIHSAYGGGVKRSLKSLPLFRSMVTKAADQKPMRIHSVIVRVKWRRRARRFVRGSG